jgi:hypothetical protein
MRHGWQKGQSGNLKGRPRGSATKITLALQDELAQVRKVMHSDHPVICLYKIGINTEIDIDVRVKALSEVAEYVSYKLKSREPDELLLEQTGTSIEAIVDYRTAVIPLRPDE